VHLLLTTVGALALAAPAPPPSPPDPPPPLAESATAAPTVARGPIAVVVSGGISQGAYLAGQMYALVEHLKGAGRAQGWTRPEDFPPLVLTGASAGSISAVLMAAELGLHGLEPQPSPEASLFFRAWVPMGLTPGAESLDATVEGETGLLNRVVADRAIDALPALGKAPPPARPWAGPIRLGMQTTRMVPVPDADGPTVQVNEAFAFEFDALGGLAAPRVLYSDDTIEAERATLNDAAAVARISSAFPIAFSPVWLDCSDYRALAYWRDRPCTTDGRDAVLMFDGGVYENNPVTLAWTLLEAASLEAAPVPFVYLDPDLRGSPSAPADCAPLSRPQPDTPLEQALVLGGTVGGTFRVQSVADFARDHRGEVSLLPVCQTTAPVSGELGAFFGFFERSIRAWDFYAGMLDARRYLAHSSEALGLPALAAPTVAAGSLYHPVAAAFEDPRVQQHIAQGFDADPEPARALAAQVVDGAFRVRPDPGPGGDPMDALLAIPLLRRPEEAAFACWGPLEATPAACDTLARSPALRDPAWERLRVEMWHNLRTLTWVSLTRVLWQRPARGGAEQFAGLTWITHALSEPQACVSDTGEPCPPYRFSALDLARRPGEEDGQPFWRLFRNRMYDLVLRLGDSDLDGDALWTAALTRYVDRVAFGSTRRTSGHLSGAPATVTEPAYQLGLTERIYTTPRVTPRPIPGGVLAATGYLERRTGTWAMGAALRPALVLRAPQVVPVGSLVRPSLELGVIAGVERRWSVDGPPVWELYPGLEVNYQIWGVARLGALGRGHLPDEQRSWTDGYGWSDLQLFVELPLPF